MPLMSDKNSMSRPYNLESYSGLQKEYVGIGKIKNGQGGGGGGGVRVVYRKNTVHNNSI